MSCRRFNNVNQDVLIDGTYNNTYHIIGTSKVKVINVTGEEYTLFLDGYIIHLRPYYIGDYIKVNAAESMVVVKKKDQTIINADLLLEGSGIYTFIINGNDYLLLDDAVKCPADKLTRIRFVHVANNFNDVNVMLNNYKFDNIGYLDSYVLELKEKHVTMQISPYQFNPVKLHFKHGGVYTIILINKNNMLSILSTDNYCY